MHRRVTSQINYIWLPTVILPTGQLGRGLFFVFFLIFYLANIALIDSYFGIFLLEKVWHLLFYLHARWHKKVPLQGNLLCDTTKQLRNSQSDVTQSSKRPPALEMGLIHTERAQRTVMLGGDAGKSNSLLFATTFRLILLVVVLPFQFQFQWNLTSSVSSFHVQVLEALVKN